MDVIIENGWETFKSEHIIRCIYIYFCNRGFNLTFTPGRKLRFCCYSTSWTNGNRPTFLALSEQRTMKVCLSDCY